MKKNDIVTIIMTIFVSTIFSFIVASTFISPPENRQQDVEVVGQITHDFPEPDKKFFNEKSVNPTLLIEITPNDNQNPFEQRTE